MHSYASSYGTITWSFKGCNNDWHGGGADMLVPTPSTDYVWQDWGTPTWMYTDNFGDCVKSGPYFPTTFTLCDSAEWGCAVNDQWSSSSGVGQYYNIQVYICCSSQGYYLWIQPGDYLSWNAVANWGNVFGAPAQSEHSSTAGWWAD